MGNINTAVNEPGATLTNNSFAWDLDGDGTFETLNNPQPTHVYTSNGTFNVTLRVTDSFGSIDTDTITVTVFGSTCPLNITMQPSPQTACIGSPATFTVAASGMSTLTYQWRHNSTNIPGATGTSFTIANVAPGDAGNYDVVITDSCGTLTSNPAALTVQTVPVFTLQPISQTVAEGSTVHFVVAANNATSFQWQHNATNIPGANSVSLFIFGAQPSDDGTYTCIATDACGPTTSDPATLTVTVSCPCDWNLDTILNSQDFFDFLSAFFAGC
jgi:PKD repeat protein